ncbi:MAG: hypothetical protein CMM15_02565 [Rhodospirillaceae bacterium]|nr:hypothetical protein [Rhodospirillaceae bacterium]|tara:strand:+ start:534 stop:827 length:294 start_codon:yes stop_codon:yes gene_type:complete
MKKHNPKIIGIDSENAGFSVSFPNGFNENPLINITGIHFDCDGESAIYGALQACANYIESQIERMKSTPQTSISLDEFTNDKGKVNLISVDGVVKKI